MSATVNRLRAEARAELETLASAPRNLARRTYLVPGITDENGESAWGDPSTKADCFRMWAPRCFTNASTMIKWVTFCADAAGRAPREYHNFIQFGADLAKRIHEDLGGAQDEVDVVAHSMGGLDIAAAIALMAPPWDTEHVSPVRGVRNVVTFDTPFNGSVNAGSAVFNLVKSLQGRGQECIASQAVAMQPNSDQIKTLMAQRDRFLRNVHAFWPRGASNHGGVIEVTHESAAFCETTDFAPEWRARYRGYDDYSATEHAGPNGVTRDPRAIRDVFLILLGDVG